LNQCGKRKFSSQRNDSSIKIVLVVVFVFLSKFEESMFKARREKEIRKKRPGAKRRMNMKARKELLTKGKKSEAAAIVHGNCPTPVRILPGSEWS
jgi:hypothetical protein